METLTNDTLDQFKKLTSYDITPFLSDYVDFTDIHYPVIGSFFAGDTNVYPQDSFSLLDSLTARYQRIVDIFSVNNTRLSNYQFWILLEAVEDIGLALATANNSSKWLRSSKTSKGYLKNTQVNYLGKQGQGLEGVEKDFLHSDDPEEDWVDLALNNDLREEDYTLDGGYLIKATFSNQASVILNSVVDNIDSAEKTYGIDIDQNLRFVNNDLAVLSYQDTVIQSANILAGLQQGDNPVFPDLGIDRRIVGSSTAAIAYPAIFRQLAQSFATDDSFKAFTVLDVTRNQDSALLSFSVETRAGETLNRTVPI